MEAVESRIDDVVNKYVEDNIMSEGFIDKIVDRINRKRVGS